MASIWIRNPLAVFDPEGDAADAAGGLVVAGNRIVERIVSGGLPTTAVDETVDAADCVLLPGLINTHHHFYQTLSRAYFAALNKPLFDWLTSLYPLWRHLDPELIDVSTRLACAELMLSGCTTAVDHHYVFSNELTDAIDVQAAACGELGMRAVLTRGSMSLGEDDGGLPPQSVVQRDDVILADSERLVGRWHQRTDDAMLQIVLAPCSPFSVTPELLQQTADLASMLDVNLHTHLAETADENEFCLASFGKRPLAHMADCGWLRPGTWFAHGIHFTPAEIELLGTHQVGVAHCPNSNMMLGSGICRVQELRSAGVPVGLAVDGSASNDHSNLMQEARSAMLVQRLRDGLAGAEHLPQNPLFSAADALGIATLGGANLLQRPTLGRLSVGSVADLALFRLDEARFSGAQSPIDGLLLGGAHQATHVMINGVWKVREGAFTDMDLPALLHAHGQAAERLWAKL